MEPTRFDRLAMTYSALGTRRGLVRLLAGSALGGALAPLFGLPQTDAHNALKKCKKINDKAKRKRCVRKAKAHNATHIAPAPSGCIPSCGGKECGTNGCDGSCGSCATGSFCARGQCVIGQGTCNVGEDDCVTRTVDNCGPGCLCFTTMDNQTRCGNSETAISVCAGCDSDADCEQQHPTIPGVFCAKDTGTGNICGCAQGEGFCTPPCPS